MLAFGAVIASPAHADGVRSQQWHLDFLRAAQLHKITKGEGATVAVIDSGVDAHHPDLERNVLKGEDFVGNGDGRTDKFGHGTAMASLIAGHGHGPAGGGGVLGLAPEAKILPGRVEFGEGDKTDSDKALDWAVDQDADVVNMSFGGSAGLSHVQNALEADVVLVAAVGNTEEGAGEVSVPAAYEGVIAVSGVDRNGDFSEKSVHGPEVVLAAPMVDIMAAGAGKRGTYGAATGTSDAAAIVSGVAALIRAKYPDTSANGVINRLIKTADDKGPPGRDDKYGFGVINPLKALTADIPDIDYNPLIEGGDSSPSASTTTVPPAKAGSDETETNSYLLPALAGTTAVIILAGLGAYFFTLARRNRRRPRFATTAGESVRPPSQADASHFAPQLPQGHRVGRVPPLPRSSSPQWAEGQDVSNPDPQQTDSRGHEPPDGRRPT